VLVQLIEPLDFVPQVGPAPDAFDKSVQHFPSPSLLQSEADPGAHHRALMVVLALLLFSEAIGISGFLMLHTCAFGC
jgi:hypothetical protein